MKRRAPMKWLADSECVGAETFYRVRRRDYVIAYCPNMTAATRIARALNQSSQPWLKPAEQIAKDTKA